MSILDLIPDGTYETPIQGDGFSMSVGGGKCRFDAWRGGKHWAVPFMGDPDDKKAALAVQSLRDNGFHNQADALSAAWGAYR